MLAPTEIREVVLKLCEKVKPVCPYVFFHINVDSIHEGECGYGIGITFVQYKGWVQANTVACVTLYASGKMRTEVNHNHPAAKEATEICNLFQSAFADYLRDKENAGFFDTRIS